MIYLKDEEFIRGDCPMTKEEVRILSTAKLQLREDYRVLDIGAGTGSVSIQMAKICYKGEVIAIEKEEEALTVLEKNKKRFDATNLKIIKGEALELETSVEGVFDGIFIGGSGGNIEQLIESYGSKLKSGCNMVLNFITMDNLHKAVSKLRSLNYEVDYIQVSINRVKGKSDMVVSNNSIFIVTAVKP